VETQKQTLSMVNGISVPYKPPAIESNKETIKRLQKLHEQSMKRILTKQANGGYSNG
jgi:hypothetical protein